MPLPDSGSCSEVMLVFTPLGLASQSLGWDQVTTFVLCFLAIVPLAKLQLGLRSQVWVSSSRVSLDLAAWLGDSNGLWEAVGDNEKDTVLQSWFLQWKEMGVRLCGKVSLKHLEQLWACSFTWVHTNCVLSLGSISSNRNSSVLGQPGQRPVPAAKAGRCD